MQVLPSEATSNCLLERMRSETMTSHKRLDSLVMSHDPFGKRENYIPFLRMQYCFHSDLERIYQDKNLQTLFPLLPQRSRLTLLSQDLEDLRIAKAPLKQRLVVLQELTLQESLGWLFVSEGSRLGAVSLSRRAAALGLSENFGARHLASPPEGAASAWHEFTRIISRLLFSREEEDLAVAGALAAFAHIIDLAKMQMWSNREAMVHA